MAKKPKLSTTIHPSPAEKSVIIGGGWSIKAWKNESSVEPSQPVVASALSSEPAVAQSQTTVASESTLPDGLAQDSKRTGQAPDPDHHADGHEKLRQGWRRRSRPILLLAGLCAALAALAASDVLRQQLASGLATAEAHPSLSGLTPNQETKRAEAAMQALIVNTPPQRRTAPSPDAMTPRHVNEMAALVSPTSDDLVDGSQQAEARGGYRLELGAYRKEIGARFVWAGYQADLGSILDGLDPYFERVQSEEGTFYLVQAGTLPSHDEADRLCAQLQERDVACFIVRR